MSETFDRLMHDGKVLIDELGEKTDRAVEIGRLKIELMDTRQNRNKQYTALGELAAALAAAGESIDQDADVGVLCDRIANYNSQISELTRQLEVLRHRG